VSQDLCDRISSRSFCDPLENAMAHQDSCQKHTHTYARKKKINPAPPRDSIFGLTSMYLFVTKYSADLYTKYVRIGFLKQEEPIRDILQTHFYET
jgi:hypothetical protein